VVSVGMASVLPCPEVHAERMAAVLSNECSSPFLVSCFGSRHSQDWLPSNEFSWVMSRRDDALGLEACPPQAQATALALHSEGLKASSLLDIGDGPCLVVAAFLDATGLCCIDATARALCQLTAYGGPWRSLGSSQFRGLACMDRHFDEAKGELVEWKRRYLSFARELSSFSYPLAGCSISSAPLEEMCAFCQCRINTDVLGAEEGRSVYIEVEVLKNPDSVSLALVDSDSGGCSSMTFSPEMGAVFREKKVSEEPRHVKGDYIQPLPETERHFQGTLGIHILNGRIAFFRRASTREGEKGETDSAIPGPWECTGFVGDLSWAHGPWLTPCLAFRQAGPYEVRIVRVSATAPLVPQEKAASLETQWRRLDWE